MRREDVVDRHDVVLPISDFLYSDYAGELLEGGGRGVYAGIHRVGDHSCHHISFNHENIDWQIWIDTGDKPLPRKLAIAYKHEPGTPRYTATFRNWSLSPELADSLFRFEPPEGAAKMEFGTMVESATMQPESEEER